jgi:hypothetical protein
MTAVVAVLLAVLAWALLALSLTIGGLDASSTVSPQLIVLTAGVCALGAVVLGAAAAIRGRRRMLALLGLGAAIVWLLVFLGVVPL